MEALSYENYYTLEEITQVARQLSGEPSGWTLEKHQEWRTFMYW